MNPIKPLKKLQINRESLRNLSATELGEVNGGYSGTLRCMSGGCSTGGQEKCYEDYGTSRCTTYSC